MPLNVFKCPVCRTRIETLQREPRHCGKRMIRILSAPALIKGGPTRER